VDQSSDVVTLENVFEKKKKTRVVVRVRWFCETTPTEHERRRKKNP